MSQNIKILFIVTFLVFAVHSCKQKESNLPVQSVYYQFENFDASPEAEQLLGNLIKAYDTLSFIITTDEQFVALNKNQDVNLDTLNKFHPKGHRIIPVTDKTKFVEGDEKLIVKNVDSDYNKIFGFEYKRYVYTPENTWKLKYDLGIHPLEGVPKDSVKRLQYIVDEIARASYK